MWEIQEERNNWKLSSAHEKKKSRNKTISDIVKNSMNYAILYFISSKRKKHPAFIWFSWKATEKLLTKFMHLELCYFNRILSQRLNNDIKMLWVWVNEDFQYSFQSHKSILFIQCVLLLCYGKCHKNIRSMNMRIQNNDTKKRNQMEREKKNQIKPTDADRMILRIAFDKSK